MTVEQAGDDLRLSEIGSPLSENVRLCELLDTIDRRWAALEASGQSEDDAATEGHFALVDALAVHLSYQAEMGSFAFLDWEASFLTNPRMAALYSEDRHSDFRGFMKDDVEAFLSGPDWQTEELSRLHRGEAENLVVLLSRLEVSGGEEALAAVRRQLSSPD